MGVPMASLCDRLEAGMDPFSVLTAIARPQAAAAAPPWWSAPPPIKGIWSPPSLYASLDFLTGGRVIAGVGTGLMFRDMKSWG